MWITRTLYGIKRNTTEWLSVHLSPKDYYCSICDENFAFFNSCGEKSELFENRPVIGGGCRKKVVCPRCGANDRNRWVDYCLEHYTDIYDIDKKVLHIAPEKSIERKMRETGFHGYITGDICPGVADDVVDITHMSYEDGSFDYLIINHVMEHVKDEDMALKEIFRVLKVGGAFIFSMPICTDLNETYESGRNMSDIERLREYGQKDHYRLYGGDVVSRVSKYGFSVKSFRPDEMLKETEIEKFRFLKDDYLFIGVKLP